MSAEEGPSSAPSNESAAEFLPGYPSVEDFTKNGFKILMEAIRHSNSLPTGADWEFYKALEAFPKLMSQEGSHILRMMNSIMRANEIDSSIKNRVLDDKTELVVEANDVILERVSNNINLMMGIRQTPAPSVVFQTVSAPIPINGSWNRINSSSFSIDKAASQIQSGNAANCIKLITAKDIIRPQKFFKDKLDNSSKFPWEPRIPEKPNSLKPLAIFLEEVEDRQEFSHPYELELDRFIPTAEQLRLDSCELPKPISQTPLIEIDKPEQLDDMVEALRNCKQFAVDVEHHSYRSFMGFTCLVQISTKSTDYIIDALSLRDKLYVLNEVFTKPTIVKIFHGADKDVEWLQRDLSIYIVNMFDTHLAAKALGYSGLSLAYLMKRFCNVVPNKQFQLADWRIRPLPDEFKAYAREDTHYLIYIYQMLKGELLAKGNNCDNILKAVIQQSTEICKKRYFKPMLTEDSHLNLYRRFKKMFDNRQMYALKELYAWRDRFAREEDESLGYVMPNHMLLQIAEVLPREMQGILACCNPIPPLVQSNLLDLHQIILKAREQSLEKPIFKEDTRGRGTTKQVSKVNVDSPLYCPHDLSKNSEFRDDLPTILNHKLTNAQIIETIMAKLSDNIKTMTVKCEIETTKTHWSVFSDSDNSDIEEEEKERARKLHGISYLSPYERYMRVKPYLQAEEEKEAAQRKEEEELQAQGQHKAETSTNDRTDEERIASIREHFLDVSQQYKSPGEDQQLMSLTQMGGSRKRKRQNSPYKRPRRDPPQSTRDVGEKFQNPLPDYFSVDGNTNNSRNETPNLSRNQKRKLRQHAQQKRQLQQEPQPNQRRNKQQQQQNQQQGQWNQQPKQMQPEQRQMPQQNQQQHKQQQQQQHHKQQQHQQQHKQQQQQPQNNQNRQQPPKNTRKRKGDYARQPQKQNACSNSRTEQGAFNNMTANSFVPYDYGSVDFRQFQGGAGSVNAESQLNAKPKNKRWRRPGKKGTKSATFGQGKNR